MISPTFVIDASLGQNEFAPDAFPEPVPTQTYGSDVLGIPGTNQGALPGHGGVPNFAISSFVTMGASYPPLEYFQPVYEYVANATKIKGSHTIRFGADLATSSTRVILKSTNNQFNFTGGVTTLKWRPRGKPVQCIERLPVR